LKIHAADVDASKELSIQQYLAAKSPKDFDSNFVLLSLDSFVLEGPNGKHHCLVADPMGPSISAVLNAPPEFYDPLNPPTQRFPTPRNKSFLRNILCGLKFLHNNNVVHGDLQSGNVLFSLKHLTALDPSKLEQNETNSTLDPLVRVDRNVDRWAPKYLAVPEPLTKEALPLDEQVIKLADFGGGKYPWIVLSSSRSLSTNLNIRL
jgi:serine/threonine protein kinase